MFSDFYKKTRFLDFDRKLHFRCCPKMSKKKDVAQKRDFDRKCIFQVMRGKTCFSDVDGFSD